MMTGKPRAILIDTNVWLDVFDSNRARSAEANKLIDVCMSEDIDMLYAATSSKDLYYLISASLKRQARAAGEDVTPEHARAISAYASSCVDAMCDIATTVGMDVSDIRIARAYQKLHADYEDTLVYAAAQRSKADLLVSSDKDMVRHAPVPALILEDVLTLLA